MKSTLLKLVCFAGFASFAVCIYPTNMTFVSDFRQITVSFNKIDDFNKSGDATWNLYYFEINPLNIPDVKRFIQIEQEPKTVIKDLLINSKIKLRVSLRTHDDLPDSAYSPWYTLGTRDAVYAGNVIVPGKVSNIKAIQNPDKKSSNTAIITFEDPENVKSASYGSKDADVQYLVEACTTNIFTTQNSDCKILAQFSKDASTFKQTTEVTKTRLVRYPVRPDQKRDIAILVTATSLNGTLGPVEQKITRIDPTSKPAKPTNLRSSEVYKNQLKLQWTNAYKFDTAYVMYKIKGGSITLTKTFSSNNPIIDGLNKRTTYEFQVGLYTKDNGGSAWSDKYEITTTNDDPPPPPQPSSGNNVTSSIAALVSLLAIIWMI